MIRKPLLAGIWALAVVAAAAPVTRAQQTTYTWNGGGAPDGNWSNPANWGGVVPANDETNTLIALAGTTNLNTTLDLLSGTGGGLFNVRSLTFNANAGSFVINPTATNVTTLRIGVGGITVSNSTDVTLPPPPPPNIQPTLNSRSHTINAPIALSANQSWNVVGTGAALTTPARLTVNGTVDLGGNTLTTNVALGLLLNQPPGEVRFNAAVSNGSLVKTGTGTATLNAATTLNSVAVNGGALGVNRVAAGANPFGPGAITLGGGALSFRTPMNPIAIAAPAGGNGFNHDVITSYSDSLSPNPFGTTTALDAATGAIGFVLTEFGANVNPGVEHTGLPTGGLIVSTANTLATYQLAAYGANGAVSNNVRQLADDHGNNGSLVLTTPAPFSTISVLSLGGGGAANFTARLHFSDGTNTLVSGLTSPDWFNQAPFAITALGRMEREDGIFDNQTNNPRLYPVDIHLSAADQAKNLARVEFTRTGGGRLNLFGISGTSPAAGAPTGYANPVTLTASSTIEMWGTPSLTLGPLSVNGNFTLTTVAGGVTTLTFPGTSMTGNPGFTIAANQTFTPGPLDFNSAARTVTKNGAGLMILDAAGVDATATNRLTVTAGTATVTNGTALGTSPNLTVSGGTANLGPYTSLTSLTVSGGTANLPNVTSVPTATVSGGTANFTLHPTITTATATGGTTNLPAGATISTATVNAGTVTLGAASSAGRLAGGGIAGTVAINGAGTALTVGGANLNDTYAGALTGTGSLVKVGTGTQTLTRGFSTYSGGTTVSAGKLVGTQPGTLGTGTVTLQDGATLGIGGVPGATIFGFGGNGTGWSLQGFLGANPSAPTVATDVLTITTANNDVRRTAWFNTKQSTADSFTATFDYLRSGGSADPADGASFTIQNQLGDAVGGGGGSLGLNGITPSGSVLINIFNTNGRGIRVTTNGTTGAPYSAVAPIDLVNSGTNPVTFTVNYDAVAKTLNVSLAQGSNTFNLPTVTGFDLSALGPNAWVGFTGATGGLNTIQQFTNFRYNIAGSTPPPVSTYTNAVTIANGASVTITPRVANQVTTFAMGALSMGSGASLAVQPDTGSLADTAYNLTLGATTLNGPATFTVANNGTGVGTLTLGAVSDGGTARTITKAGAGTLTLAAAAASLVNGTAVNVNTGTLRVNNPTALGNLAAVAVAPGANLALGANQTVGALTGAGTATVNGNTLTVGSTNNLSSVFDGTIVSGSGPGGLTKAGAGTLTLAGNSPAFSGAVLVSDGLLRAVNTAGTATGTGPVTVNGPGRLDGTGSIAGPVALNDGGTLQGGVGGATAADKLTLSGGLQLDGANTFRVFVTDTNTGNGTADPAASRIDLGSAILSRNTGGTASDLTTIRLAAVPDSLDAFTPYTITIANFGGTSNLDLMNFTIDPSPTGFAYDGTPFLTLTGSTLTMTFTPTSEPQAVLAAAILAGLAAAGLRRRLLRPTSCNAGGGDRPGSEVATVYLVDRPYPG